MNAALPLKSPFLVMTLLGILLASGTARSLADMQDGLAAYDAGEFAAARDAWEPLAEAGDAAAQLALAELLMEGLTGRSDPAGAAQWYRRAAEQGDAVGQLNLGELYLKGTGVERDLALAAFWLTLSARQGRHWPRARLEEIEPLMTKAEREEAARLLAADVNRRR